MNEDRPQHLTRIDYAAPQQLPRGVNRSYVATVIMAWLWPFAAVLAGVSSDRVVIPPPKQIALTASAIIVAILMICQKISPGFIGLWVIIATVIISVMVFWN